ncbi:MAG: pyridoxamine 5'-phosphate oxidase family protein [Pseudomonadota bacterium]
MAQRFTEIKDSLRKFIEKQHIFFVGTAAADGRVNISPKGMDSLRVLDQNHVLWLNVTGSGNETAAHVQELSRMTLMFCAFTDAALILRLYGTARVIHVTDPEWPELYAHFTPNPAPRQIFQMTVDLVQTSCGTAVPFFDYVEDREELNEWAAKKDEEGIRQYWLTRNELSVDGKDTGMRAKLGDD